MLRQGCSSTSHQRLTLLPVCTGLRKTLSSSCFILNLCRQTLFKIIYSYKQLCMKHRVRAVVPSWLTRVFSMLILFYLNVCAERNEEELLIGLLACQSLAIIIRHLTVSAFTPWWAGLSSLLLPRAGHAWMPQGSGQVGAVLPVGRGT